MAKSFVLVAPPRPRERLELAFRRALWIAIIVLVLASLGGLFFEFFISPNMLVRKIELASDLPLSQEEIVSLAGLSGTAYYFAIDSRAVEARLKTNPLVKQALVEKVFPETLKLTLVRRQPLAVAYAAVDGVTVPLVFDDEGVLFARGGPAARNLPVLSGIKLAALAPGTAVAPLLRPFLKDLGALKTANESLYNLISEIRVVGESSGSYELIVYPMPYSVRVWIGKRLNPGMLRYMFFTLNFMQKQGLLKEVDEVDFRSGEAVYKRKGE